MPRLVHCSNRSLCDIFYGLSDQFVRLVNRRLVSGSQGCAAKVLFELIMLRDNIVYLPDGFCGGNLQSMIHSVTTS
jgi:hypothetical protein